MTLGQRVDLSNSHLRDSSVAPCTAAPCTATEAGVDTWRLIRYLDDDSELAAMSARVSARGVLPEKVGTHTVGVLPGHRMLWIEGHPVVDGLAPSAELRAAEQRVLSALADAGLPVGLDAGIGRLDQTVTLRFVDGQVGRAFLAGLAAVDVPRLKPARYGRPGQPETVYWLGERSGRRLARVYDKGVESGLAGPGELIRLENQTRFGKQKRMRAAVHAEAGTVPGLFEKRFAPIAESCEGLTAATMALLAERLVELANSGKVTTRQAERLAGFLWMEDRGVRQHRRTRQRRRRELRQHGLVLADPFSDPLEVDLGQPLEAALAAWTDAEG